MKVLNVVLSVLILVLAAVSAVSSYFLFVKRGQMIKGWEKITTVISQTASTLDEKSGTRVGAELTKDTLSHKEYDSLDAKLAKLNSQARTLVAQRDALAEAVRSVATIVRMSNVPESAEYTHVEKFGAHKDNALKGAQDFRNSRDKMINDIIATAQGAGLTLNREALLASGSVSEAEFKKFIDKVNGIRGQFAAYQTTLKSIGGAAGAAAPNFDDASYAKSLSAIEAAVLDLKSKYSNALAQVETDKRNIAANNKTIQDNKSQIATLESTIGKKDIEIKQYRVALGLEEWVQIAPWQPGSPEARQAVRGKVVEVNEKFGFLALDLGRDTLVTQEIGNKTIQVNPEIGIGQELFVARNMDSSSAQYVGRIRLSNVDSDCAIAESFELCDGQQIKAGDAVFFYNPIEAKKAEEAAPAPAAPATEEVKKEEAAA